MKYTTLLTDLDDTLIKSGKIYDKALMFSSRFLSEKYGVDEQKFYDKVVEKHTIVARNFPTVHTRHSRILVFRMALDEMVQEYDLSLLPEVEDLYWDYFIKNLELYPNVVETFEQLKDLGVEIAIVSDGDLSLRIRKAKAAGIIKIVDEIVASEEVIFEKPFSAIFTLALSRVNSHPDDAIMIGNDYKNDIRGAQLVGVKSGIFNPDVDPNVLNGDETTKPDFELKDLSELVPIMKGDVEI